jgi:hypothetical protein
MEYFIIAAFAFFIGWKGSQLFHVISFKKILEDLNVKESDLRRLHNKLAEDLGEAESQPEPQETKTVIDIKVEQHQGMLFAYEVKHDTFVAQGQNGDELLSRILDKYPVNVRVVCDRSNGGDYIEDAVKKMVNRNG